MRRVAVASVEVTHSASCAGMEVPAGSRVHVGGAENKARAFSAHIGKTSGIELFIRIGKKSR
jgi:hypothetical protein